MPANATTTRTPTPEHGDPTINSGEAAACAGAVAAPLGAEPAGRRLGECTGSDDIWFYSPS
jgi:hypothetical protein